MVLVAGSVAPPVHGTAITVLAEAVPVVAVTVELPQVVLLAVKVTKASPGSVTNVRVLKLPGPVSVNVPAAPVTGWPDPFTKWKVSGQLVPGLVVGQA